MKKLSRVLPWLPVLAALTPLIASGQTVDDVISVLDDATVAVIYLLMAVAVMVFLWGIVKFIAAGADMEKAKEAKGYIIYGLIGLLVMIAFWGIITVILDTFNITPGGAIEIPEIPGP